MKKTTKIKNYIVSLALLLGLFSFAGKAFASAPTMLTTGGEATSETQATLNGFFNTNGSNTIMVRFEYGTTPTPDTFTDYQTFNFVASDSYSATITVTPGETYYYRAMGMTDMPGFGSISSFTVPNYSVSSVLTTPATNIGSTSATLNGFFNGNGSPTTTWFSYANNSSFIGAYTTPQVSQSGNFGSFNETISGLTPNTTYYVKAYAQNSGGSAFGQALTFTTTSGIGTNCTIDSFYANPTSVVSGGSGILYWSTSNCSSATLSGNAVATSGSQNFGPLYATGSYTLSATGTGGSVSQTVTVNVTTNGGGTCTINSFYGTPNNVVPGSSSTLYWSTTDCSSVYISGGNISGTYGTSGSLSTGSLYGNTTYNIQAYGAIGSPSNQTTITVSGNGNGNNNCVINSFYPNQSVITAGSYTTLSWNTSNCSSVYISGGTILGAYGTSGTVSTGVLWAPITNYFITAYGVNGSTQSQTSVSTSTGNIYNNNYACSDGMDNDSDGYTDMNDSGCINTVDTDEYNNTGSQTTITSVATNIGTTSATLNGLTYGGTGNATSYFEWSSSSSLGFSTNQESLGSASTISFSKTITGLTPQNYYYFRAVTIRNGNTTKGSIQTFQTNSVNIGNNNGSNGNQGSSNTVINQTIVSGGGSGSNLIALELKHKDKALCSNDLYDMTITYKNVSGKKVEDVIVRVLLPQTIVFRSATAGIYTNSDHALTLSVGDMVKDEEGVIYVTGQLKNQITNEDVVVTTGTASYTHPTTGVSEDSIAYGVIETGACRGGNSLAGLALFSGFFPQTVFGWFILILLVIIILIIVRELYGPKNKKAH